MRDGSRLEEKLKRGHASNTKRVLTFTDGCYFPCSPRQMGYPFVGDMNDFDTLDGVIPVRSVPEDQDV